MARPKIEIDLDEVERLAARGLSQADICRCLRISTDTLERRKKDWADFAETLARGRALGKMKVSNALFEEEQREMEARMHIFNQAVTRYLRGELGD